MADAPKTVTAALLLIGNELLSGRTQDANLNYLARQLTAMGIRLAVGYHAGFHEADAHGG